MKKSLFVILLLACVACKPKNNPESLPCDYVVYGTIYTAEHTLLGAPIYAEAMVVKDGQFIFVGSKADAQPYLSATTKVLDFSDRGMIMPSCANAHAHYMMAFGFETVGVVIKNDETPSDFLTKTLPAAIAQARAQGSTGIFGFGWNYFLFKTDMPTRQQLDDLCADIPMYFVDDEGHKGLTNTAMLVQAGIMTRDGQVIKKGKDIRGGEIQMGPDSTPTGLLKEQAGTYVRSRIDNDHLYSKEVAADNLRDIQRKILAEGYTMYMDGWSNYFFNDHFYQAARQMDEAGEMHFVLGLSHEIESWANLSEALAAAKKERQLATRHVLPHWVKIFIDGTVESGTGYSQYPYPDGHQGLVNWSQAEVTDITRQANSNDLSMHIHTMGDSAVALAVDAFVAGGQDERRNTVVHVRNILPSTLRKMADHHICAVAGMLWHHMHWLAPIGMSLFGLVPVGYEDYSYPIRCFFDYGVNVASHSDFPATSGSPDDPFGIMEIAVTGVQDPSTEDPWWTAELITRDEALQALTINGAHQLFLEHERGSIKAGKYADFLVLDQNVMTCPVRNIHNTKVLKTFFEGRQVYPAE